MSQKIKELTHNYDLSPCKHHTGILSEAQKCWDAKIVELRTTDTMGLSLSMAEEVKEGRVTG